MDLATLLQLTESTIRLATPLLLACLAGLFSERAGIFDIGLEGKMLISAFFSAAIAFVTGSVWLGLLAGIAASLALSTIHGLASITFRGNQLISGVALNFLASGLTVLIAQNWFRQGGKTPTLPDESRLTQAPLPFADIIGHVPVIGPFYAETLAGTGQFLLVVFAFLAVPMTWWILFRTRFGLRLRAVGEAPESVDTAGISVIRLRFTAVLICGVLCGIAGAYMATGLQPFFGREMTAGRGYIALAALIFAKWRPWYALMSCLLFGFLQAMAIRYQNLETSVWGIVIMVAVVAFVILLVGAIKAILQRKPLSTCRMPFLIWLGASFLTLLLFVIPALNLDLSVPVQVMDALPYILTVVILAGFVGKAIPPRAGGEPYVKER